MQNPITLNLKDGGLGKGKDGIDGLHLKIGVSEEGNADTLYPINNENEAAGRFGRGSLVNSLVRHFKEGGVRCYAMRPVNDVAGEIGTVTHSGTGTAVCTPSGTPTGARSFVIEIITGGTHAVATYRWSEDGGVNWSDIYITPAESTPITLSAGVSIAFSGTSDCFVAGDTYSLSSTAPSASVTNFLAAIDAARAQFNPNNAPYRFIHIVGGFERSVWESVGDKTAVFEEDRIFISFIMEYPEKETAEEIVDYIQDMVDESRLFNHKRVAVVGSRIRYGSDTDFKSASILLCANLSQCRVNIHPGWVKEYKSLTGKEIQYWDTLKDYIDSLDESNVIAACQYQNWDGIYIKKDHLMSPADSDFQTIHDLRPADKIRFLAYNKIMPFVNSDNNPAEGDSSGINSLIAELDGEISQQMEKAGEMEIAGHEIDINEGQDLSDGELEGKIHIYKTDTMEKISIDVGYRKAE